jgi:hypothetical protein
MFNLKNVRSLWIYGVLLGVLILSGAVFAFTRDSVFSKTWNVFSICVFSPDINSKNKALIDPRGHTQTSSFRAELVCLLFFQQKREIMFLGYFKEEFVAAGYTDG